ncbi:hypothetical protein [Mesomycoplasma molare]|uniref:Uncharacterized protein n=1 Tax=Mesomycoplasma molare TaxID=171288 RepID=A0ABY5TXQ4_9BACT|nr:hypothetical protein [Mesomycoplasma molare]UWD34013.1 hypothetical protein NX772_02805 [Mesomycoplasma molare]
MIKFNILGIFFFVLLLLFQIFIFFIYKVNLRIKYQKFHLISKEKPLEIIKNDIQKKEKNKTFNISLKENYFHKKIDYKKNIFYVNEEFLNDTIFSFVNLIFLKFYLEETSEKKEKINLVFKIVFLISITTFIVLMTLNLIYYSISFISIAIIIIITDLIINHRVQKNIYIKTKNYFIEKYNDQYLNFIFSYLKYKKFDVLNKYSTFYIEVFKQLILSFKNWGLNER